MNHTLNLTGLRLYYWAMIINLISSAGSAIVEYAPIWDYLSIATLLLMAIALFSLAPLNDSLRSARNYYCLTVVLPIVSIFLAFLGPSALWLSAILLLAATILSVALVFIVMRGISELCIQYRSVDLSDRIDAIRKKYGNALALTIGSMFFLLIPYINVFAVFAIIVFSVWVIVLSIQWINCASQVYTTLHGTTLPQQESWRE